MEHGYRAWAGICVLSFVFGFPLEMVEKSLTQLMDRLAQYRVDSIRIPFERSLIVVQQLRGSSPNRVNWKKIREDLLIPSARNIQRSVSERTERRYLYWSYIQLAFLFRKFDIAYALVEPLERLSKTDDSGYHLVSVRLFYTGLIASSLARIHIRTRRYKLQAKKSAREMKATIIKQKAINNLHRYQLMIADMLAMEPKKSFGEIKAAYDKGIATAGRAGFTQDTAIGNELAAEYCLSMGEEFWAKTYLNRAYELYKEWGAEVKLETLLETRGSYIDVAPDIHGKGSWRRSISRIWGQEHDILIHESVNLDKLTMASQTLMTDLSATLDEDRSLLRRFSGVSPMFNSDSSSWHAFASSDDSTTSFENEIASIKV